MPKEANWQLTFRIAGFVFSIIIVAATMWHCGNRSAQNRIDLLKDQLEKLEKENESLASDIREVRGQPDTPVPDPVQSQVGELRVRAKAGQQTQLFDDHLTISVTEISYRGIDFPQLISFRVAGRSGCAADFKRIPPGTMVEFGGLLITVESITVADGAFRVSQAPEDEVRPQIGL